MSAVADRPEDNKDDSNKDAIPLFNIEDKVELPFEKQFTHMLFCQQVSSINIDDARTLLEQLHYLYLSQQFVVSKLVKQEFLGNM